jgi:hypothetical protein
VEGGEFPCSREFLDFFFLLPAQPLLPSLPTLPDLMETVASYTVRVFLVAPPLVGLSHPKRAVLRLAGSPELQGALSLRVRKVSAEGLLRVIVRGVSEKVTFFLVALRSKVRNEAWQSCSEDAVAQEDRAEMGEGEGLVILPTPGAFAGTAKSSGGVAPPPDDATYSCDTSSSGSASVIVNEVRVERERGEAVARVVAAAAADHEAAAVAAAETAAREAAGAAVAAAEAAAAAAEAAAAAAEAAAAAAEAVAREALAAALSVREASIAALMKHLNMTRVKAENTLGFGGSA